MKKFSAGIAVALMGAVWASLAAAQTSTLAVGTNVNMAGGVAKFEAPSTIVGDPFLQRQNEPSLALSSRNPCHILAGANDYRLVDVEEAAGEVGDAWMGIFKSFDCGHTWTSTLLPGYRLDQSPEGMASPLKGLQAAADPTVRAGTNGIFYVSGIAFNRGDNQPGKVFVARFLDNNNKDGGDPIQYLDTTIIETGTSGQFLDKPWIVADVPRDGHTCVINGRTVPAGTAYLAYTSFVGGDNNVHSKILVSRSTDCGQTWSNATKLSEQVDKNQGTVIAVDPGTGDVYVAWREFAAAGDSNSRNAILVSRSTDGGKSFTKASAIAPGGYQLNPFDQASSPITFRTNAYPTMAVVPAEAEGRAAGQPGRIYVAWSARGFGGQRATDARIIYTTSIDGQAWTTPVVADAYPGAGHQIMPTMAFSGGRLALAYYDLREDRSLGFDELVIEYGQAALVACTESAGGFGFSGVLACMADPNNMLALKRRHTLDLRAAMADADCLKANTCAFTSYSVGTGSRKVSRYIEGFVSSTSGRQPLQYNRPNLPLFSKGRFPFIGDYIDIAGESFLATADGRWTWNTGRTVGRPAPVFHVSWTDNRNVGSPRDRNWENFTPAVTGPNSVVCTPGQAGVRNQDVYTATLRPALVVSAPLNSKRIAGLQRSFVVVAENATSEERTYQLTADPGPGVIASFNQFSGFDGSSAPQTTIGVTIPRKSTVSRTVFVGLEAPPADGSAAPDVLVPVSVVEVAINPSTGQVGPTGVDDTVYLNPDFENPDFENPDFENAELHNPDFENPDFENPDFENPDFENFTLSASSPIRNPDFENPDFENPDFENPDFENPDFENPDFENPDFENPDFENPDFENGTFEVADTTFPMRNNGNTTSAYKANVYVNNPPEGVKFQLVVRRQYPSPAAVCAPGGASPGYSAQNQAAVNIVGPDVQASLFNRNFNDPGRDNATFYLSPGERALVTLRAYCAEGVADCSRPLLAGLEGNVALGVIAQGANCVKCAGGDCSNSDFVGGPTECRIDDGPPKDIFDPVPPAIGSPVPGPVPTADDTDNSGDEPVTFTITASDNLGISSLSCSAGATTLTPAAVAGSVYTFTGNFGVGTTLVTCVASDLRETPGPNTSSTSFDVVVNDVTPPSFDVAAGPDAGAPYVPGNPAEATGPNGAVVFYTNPTATDSNGGPVTVACASPGGLVSGSTFPIGTTPIDCVATDDSGISTPPTELFDISVADRTPPAVTISGAPAAAVEGNALGGAVVTFTSSALDVVSGSVAASCTPASGSIFPLGATTAVCSATDGAGNTGTATAVVVVVDTTPPVITLAGQSTVTVEAGSAYLDPGASAADVVAGVTAVSATGAVNTSVPGTYVVSYTTADPSGNNATATRTVVVRDTTAPVIAAAGNITAEATSAAGAVVTYASPTWTDLVSGSGSASCAPASGVLFAMGSTTVVCTASDQAGNAAAPLTFAVTVRDTTPPVIGPAASLVAEATSASGAIVGYAAPTWTDAVSGGGPASCAPVSGSWFALGSTTVVCSASDDAGNLAAPQAFTVQVLDTTPPSLTVPAGITVSGTGSSGAPVSYSVSASDAVTPSPSVACVPASGSTFPYGATTVTCTATDGSGNSTVKTFAVTVVDLTAPATLTAAVTPALLWPPDGSIVNVTVSGVVVDNQTGAAKIEWSVKDEYGSYQPTGAADVADGPYSFAVPLLRDRKGNDKDGRHYTINLTAVDRAGNRKLLATPLVVNVHDQSK